MRDVSATAIYLIAQLNGHGNQSRNRRARKALDTLFSECHNICAVGLYIPLYILRSLESRQVASLVCRTKAGRILTRKAKKKIDKYDIIKPQKQSPSSYHSILLIHLASQFGHVAEFVLRLTVKTSMRLQYILHLSPPKGLSFLLLYSACLPLASVVMATDAAAASAAD